MADGRSTRRRVGQDCARRRTADQDRACRRPTAAGPSSQARGQPPVAVAQQAHRRRHEQRANDRRVQGDGDRDAQAERLDQHDVGEGERTCDDDDDQRRRRDDAAAALHAARHRFAVVARPVVDLLHARQQEDLVVHRQPEQDAEQDHRQRRFDEAERREAEQRRQVAVLEDPDERAEAGRDRQRVDDERLGRQHHRAQQHEQDEVGRDQDEQRRAREVRRDARRRRRAPRPRRHRRARVMPAGGARLESGSRMSSTSAWPSARFGP